MRIAVGDLSVANGIWIVVGVFVIVMLRISFFSKKRHMVSFSFFALLPDSTFVAKYLFFIKYLLVTVVTMSLFVLLSQPQRSNDSEKIVKKGIDIILALDISYSMEADDFPPNRLVVAKQVLSGFIEELESDRVGMVVFAGMPFTAVPLTFDYAIFQDILQRTETTSIQQAVPGLQGTAIGDAILSSLQILEKGRSDEQAREQVLILVTDGAANQGVEPRAAAAMAKEQGVRIYTIGVGSEQGGFITQQTAFGTRRQQVEGVDEPTLRALATITDGQYRRAVDARSFQQIVEELKKLQRHELEIEQHRLYKPLYGPFVLIAVCGVVLLRIQEKRRKIAE